MTKPKGSSGAQKYIAEMQNSLEGFKSRFQQTEDSLNLKIRQWQLLSLKKRNKMEEKPTRSKGTLGHPPKQISVSTEEATEGRERKGEREYLKK